MSVPGPNLLDLLDELRELPAAQQQRRLGELPPVVRQTLQQWLSAPASPSDAFESDNALAAMDPALFSQLRSSLKNLSPDELETIEKVDSKGATTGAAARPPRRQAPESGLKFQTGDLLLRQFRIVCQLGRGGMGEVFRAIDEHTGEPVALKFLPDNRSDNAESLGLLKSEVRAAHRIRSPYACAVHGLYLDNDPAPGRKPLPPFISMQFIEGEDLSVLLRRVERLSGPKVIRIANELAQGMAAIHAAGILHRDLKPSNVMLDLHGTVQILDFGLASAAHPDQEEGTSLVAGTPAYMAPEARRGSATAAADIYAIGLILFELATGQMAWRLLQTTPDVRQMLERFRSQIPPELYEPVARCLAHDPLERFASMEELIRALPQPPATRNVVRESISTIARSDAVAPLRPRAIVAVLALIAILVIAIFMTPSPAGSVISTRLQADSGELAGVARTLAAVFDAQNEQYKVWGFSASGQGDLPGGGPVGSGGSVYFWYRSADFPLEPVNAIRGISISDPPPASGMTTIRLDPGGHLIEAFRLPQGPSDYVWNGNDQFPQALADQLDKMKEAIGPIHSSLTYVRGAQGPAGWSPPVPFPSNTDYWIDLRPEDSSGRGRAAVGALGTKVLYVGRVPPPAAATLAAMSPSQPPARAMSWLDRLSGTPMRWLKSHATQDIASWWMYALPLMGTLLAARNVRMRRCDTRHAFRMAAVVFMLSLLGWVLTTHPGVTGKSVIDRWNTGIGVALLAAVEAWIGYAAVDPYARMTWKRCLIGYARFTEGFPWAVARDRIVGRSLLVGAAFGLSLAFLLKVQSLGSAASQSTAAREQTAAMLIGDNARTIGLLCRSASTAIVFSLLQFVTLVVLHWITRRRLVAVALFCLVSTLVWALFGNVFSFPVVMIYPAFGILVMATLIHEGVLACTVGLVFMIVIRTVPITLDPSVANFIPSVWVLLFLGSIVAAGFIAVLPGALKTNWLPVDPLKGGSEVFEPRDGGRFER